MSDNLAAPVIAGISAGIALLIILTLVLNSTSPSPFSTTPNNLNLAIEGLKESYRVGEPITFTLRVTGTEDCYQSPNAAIWDASSAFESIPVWSSGMPVFTCDPSMEFDHFIDDRYSWREERQITINEAGDHVFGARIGANPAVQEEFRVLNSF